MSNFWRDYRGHKISVNKSYESIEDRIARGAAESRVIGYYFYVWRRSEVGEEFRRVRELPIVEYGSEALALLRGQEAVDELLKRSEESGS